ncbi:MAG TPA: hypothetical protein VMU80_03915 [Bryobacteraceae bacterium]|nr:hypothetical protein [Bryobacteraceae bacterium]
MTDPIPAPLPATEAPHYRWYHKVSALIFIVFCLELGMFLVIFPWSNFWDHSLFSSLFPEWRGYWSNAYLRGAVSGLGVVDVYISLVEIFRLRRFSRH